MLRGSDAAHRGSARETGRRRPCNGSVTGSGGIREPSYDLPVDERVLLVEDDASIREVTTLGLEQAGLRVTAVGRRARRRSRASARAAFDLVVLDVMLPVARRLRGLPRDPPREPRADRDAHGAQRAPRHRRRPRARRGRLRDEAVRAARARRARSRPCCGGRRAPERRSRSPSATSRSTRGGFRVRKRGEEVSADRDRVPAPARARPPARSRSSRASCCSSSSGTTTTSATRGSSTPRSSGCGRRSRTTRSSRS